VIEILDSQFHAYIKMHGLAKGFLKSLQFIQFVTPGYGGRKNTKNHVRKRCLKINLSVMLSRDDCMSVQKHKIKVFMNECISRCQILDCQTLSPHC
jgi:hypothetical protein